MCRVKDLMCLVWSKGESLHWRLPVSRWVCFEKLTGWLSLNLMMMMRKMIILCLYEMLMLMLTKRILVVV